MMNFFRLLVSLSLSLSDSVDVYLFAQHKIAVELG